ncbi:MAG: hypothetical protein P1P73_10955 [Brevefilum sp.]|nr:hypothetical protein [Brevefilum sp.]MDW7754030.1 hypothetical protein [Brevefilum sp.]
MALQITKEWFIDITDDFDRRTENQKLIFWKTGITIVIAAFHLPVNTGKLELLNKIQEKIPSDALEKIVSTKGEVVGLGYTQIQKSSDEKDRLALYTFTASDTSFLQAAFYLDKPEDLDWAKSTWKNIIFHPRV